MECREGEKGLAAQDTGHVVELWPLARSFARSLCLVGGDVSGRMGGFVDLSNDTTYLY